MCVAVHSTHVAHPLQLANMMCVAMHSTHVANPNTHMLHTLTHTRTPLSAQLNACMLTARRCDTMHGAVDGTCCLAGAGAWGGGENAAGSTKAETLCYGGRSSCREHKGRDLVLWGTEKLPRAQRPRPCAVAEGVWLDEGVPLSCKLVPELPHGSHEDIAPLLVPLTGELQSSPHWVLADAAGVRLGTPLEQGTAEAETSVVLAAASMVPLHAIGGVDQVHPRKTGVDQHWPKSSATCWSTPVFRGWT